MADESGTDAVSTWLRRVGPVIDAANKIGLTTFLIILIGLGVGVAFGYLPLKPLDKLNDDHAALMAETRASASTLLAALSKAVDALDKQSTILSRIALRAQLIDCDRLIAPDARKRCFE